MIYITKISPDLKPIKPTNTHFQNIFCMLKSRLCKTKVVTG